MAPLLKVVTHLLINLLNGQEQTCLTRSATVVEQKGITEDIWTVVPFVTIVTVVTIITVVTVVTVVTIDMKNFFLQFCISNEYYL